MADMKPTTATYKCTKSVQFKIDIIHSYTFVTTSLHCHNKQTKGKSTKKGKNEGGNFD